jgi:hypothetical protein
MHPLQMKSTTPSSPSSIVHRVVVEAAVVAEVVDVVTRYSLLMWKQ